MDYKETLLMPKTEFEMRGKLPSKEPKFQARWAEMNLYEKMLEKRDGAPSFVLHDGPPYANGAMHIGHSLNKTLKDMINRSKFMEGYKIEFIPGWDTHGLPIENAMQKLGHNRKEMALSEFRNKCYDYAMQQVEIQKKDQIALGTIADYDHPYITLQKEFEANQIAIFGKMAMDGLIYKGLKPVYWSPSSESALAEAEIEYHDVKSPTIFVKFQVVDGKGILSNEDAFVIWTTTPWTIPANLAICLNERLEYSLVKSEAGNLLVLSELVDSLWEKFGLTEKEVLKTFKGRELEMITCKHPLYDRNSLVILGDHVTSDAGTGCVHTAPGHGSDDFIIGTKYGLPAYCPVDEHGCLTSEAGEDLNGLFVDDANKVVVKKLDELGALLKLEFITHSYPHDWRTKKPIIFRATDQWFASIDKIRDTLLSEIKKVEWMPAWGETRLYNMIRDRGDWCISRQRVWGVPLPIFYGEDNTPIMDQKVFDHVSELFREFGSNVWFEREAKDLLPEGYTHVSAPNNMFRKEMDTMDVWFDSGSSHTGVLKERGLKFPADLYLEGSDQYRGWFNSSLIISVAMYGVAPFKQTLSHGFILDAKGEKMSKSGGNSIYPSKVMEQYGADILRLWAASIDYQADVKVSDDILKQCAENYRKVRNTFRFLLANLNPSDFSPADLCDVAELKAMDQYMIVKLNEVITQVRKSYQVYDFVNVTATLTNFMSNELSAYYLDYTKDILYIESKNDRSRRCVQTVLYHCLDALLKLWEPILVHTCEEINDFFAPERGSIHLQTFPEVIEVANAKKIEEDVTRLLDIRDDVLKALEEARVEKVIGKSLEAHVMIHLEEEDVKLIDEMLGEKLAQWLIVSEATLTNTSCKRYEVCGVDVSKCEGHVCPRCWNIHSGSHAEGLCDRCAEVIKKDYAHLVQE